MLIPHGALLLVVDGGRMRLLRNRGVATTPELEVIEDETLSNPASHLVTRDAPGRNHESVGPVRHAYPAADPHQRREDRFAQAAMEKLKSAASKGAPVILIAAPRTLGVLRTFKDIHIEKQILAEIDKDLAHHKPTEIAMFLRDYRPRTS